MFAIILSISIISICLWTGVTSAVAAYRYHERSLIVLAVSILLYGISQAIPLANLLIGGFGPQMETWLMVQLSVLLLAIAGFATFHILGGLPRLRRKGVSLKRILLIRMP